MRNSQTKMRILHFVASPAYPAGMHHDWLEDILAVIETGSFLRAAARRNITQPAFTRRIKAIESALGTPLFDRRRKPVALLPSMRAQEASIRRLAQEMRALRGAMRMAGQGAGQGLTLACQHAITATISPRMVQHLTRSGWTAIRVRSGNRDECLFQLISGAADMVVTYEHPGAQPVAAPAALERRRIAVDTLLPVCIPALDRPQQQEIPAIGYPPDVFLGELLERVVWPDLPSGKRLAPRAETALTLAAYHYALGGIGVAWLPLSLVADDLSAGRLVRPDLGPDCALDVCLIRLAGETRPTVEDAWQALTAS